MTFRSRASLVPSALVPIRLLFAPLTTHTPIPPVFPSAAVPRALVPIRLPATTFVLVPAPVICTPSWALPLMTFREPGVVPPTVLLAAPPEMRTPEPVLDSGAVPAAVVPTRLPATVLRVVQLPAIDTPSP